jgi:hypothetical protein
MVLLALVVVVVVVSLELVVCFVKEEEVNNP